MTDTAVTRATARIMKAPHVHVGPIECNHQSQCCTDCHVDTEDLVSLPRADVQGLLDIITDLCDDHTRCSLCSTVLCATCGIGEAAGCSDRHTFEDHCVDCAGDCNVCRREVHESYEVDLAMDGRHS